MAPDYKAYFMPPWQFLEGLNTAVKTGNKNLLIDVNYHFTNSLGRLPTGSNFLFLSENSPVAQGIFPSHDSSIK